MDKTVEKWLNENFENKNTRKNYRTALNKFKEKLNIGDLGEYLDSKPDVLKDLKMFLGKLNENPPKTVTCYSNVVKLFLEEHGKVIPKQEWRQLKRRGKRPRKVRAVTRDKLNTKAQLRQIFNYCHIKSKSLFLFLISSGARTGEAIQLKIEDLELDTKPIPLAHIRDEYTKAGISGRTVPMSFEARDAIKDWLGCKDNLKKRSGKGDTYKGNLVWNYGPWSARQMWNNALKKARLAQRDSKTKRRIHHIHGLRKFFRSRIGLDREQREVIMGHTGYLDDAYLRYTEADWQKLWKAYAEVVSNVSIYEVESEGLIETVKDLKTRLNERESKERELIETVLSDERLLDLLASKLEERQKQGS